MRRYASKRCGLHEILLLSVYTRANNVAIRIIVNTMNIPSAYACCSIHAEHSTLLVIPWLDAVVY